MALTKTEKQGYERYFVYGDFSSVMEIGETIGSSTIVVEDNAGVDATATVIDAASEYAEGFKQYVRIKDGAEASSPYKITIRIETSNFNRWEVDGQIKVKET